MVSDIAYFRLPLCLAAYQSLSIDLQLLEFDDFTSARQLCFCKWHI